jgi:molybdopterin converting factor small subunit
MKEYQTVNLQLFGMFRKYSNKPQIQINAPAECSLDTLKGSIYESFKTIEDETSVQDLINSSAFARDGKVLSADAIILENDILAILPPVCGG